MDNPSVYAYPAIFTIDGQTITYAFPDLGIEATVIPEADLPRLIDVAADRLGCWLSEAFLLERPLPAPTPLEQLPLKANQKGVWIQVVEA